MVNGTSGAIRRGGHLGASRRLGAWRRAASGERSRWRYSAGLLRTGLVICHWPSAWREPASGKGTCMRRTLRKVKAPLHDIHAVVFDVDNTLLPRSKGAIVAILASTHLSRIPWLRQFCNIDADGRQLLDALQHEGIPVGIVTNGTRRKRQTLHALGLDSRMSCIFISSEAGKRKPGSAMFFKAADCLGCRPKQIVYVGDEMRADMRGAHDAGMQTIWIRRKHRFLKRTPSPHADVTVDSLSAVGDALGLMRAR